jgi:hypothetical protein
MKTKILIALIVLATSAKAQDSTSYVSGPHGGILKTVENYKIETINSYGCITAYVFKGTLKAIPNKFISGTIMFFYDNGASLNQYLIPSGTDGFTADVANTNYYYYNIQFKIDGKLISLRFENLSGIAEMEIKKTKK